MFKYLSKPRNPRYIDHGSFILCRPGSDYRINANVCIIKGENPILFDAGLSVNMLILIRKTLKVHGKKPADVKNLVVSHYHPDHVFNLFYFKNFFPNCRFIWHQKAYQNLMTFPRQTTKNLRLFTTKTLSFLSVIPQIFEALLIGRQPRNVICKEGNFIPSSDPNLRLQVIHTPGHSSGHVCLHDLTNKILFLGDHLPLTPWCDVSETAIDEMIRSIQKLLKLSSKQVEYSVRGHGNAKDHWKEVYPWEQEKARFEAHLEIIYESIDKLPKILKQRPMTPLEIASIILKNKDFRDYNTLMTTLFMPPNLSWIYCYLLKLQKENLIEEKKGKWVST